MSLSIAFSKSNSMEQSNRDSSSSCPIRDLNLDNRIFLRNAHVKKFRRGSGGACVRRVECHGTMASPSLPFIQHFDHDVSLVVTTMTDMHTHSIQHDVYKLKSSLIPWAVLVMYLPWSCLSTYYKSRVFTPSFTSTFTCLTFDFFANLSLYLWLRTQLADEPFPYPLVSCTHFYGAAPNAATDF